MNETEKVDIPPTGAEEAAGLLKEKDSEYMFLFTLCEWSLNPISARVFSEGASRTHRGWDGWYFWSRKVTNPVAGLTFLVPSAAAAL